MNAVLAAQARETIEAGSKSFALASRLFDARTRASAVMLYAWCRHCDDVIDGQELGFGQVNSSQGGAAVLEQLRCATRQACAGQPMTQPAFAALGEVVRSHDIPLRFPMQHLDGFAMDVHDRQYQTEADTLEYCYHVAGVVGVMMAMIMGARDEATLDRACDLGVAFQLTNIARDIVEDAQIGRCYLPRDWLNDAGIPRADLAEPEHRARLAELASRLVSMAEPYYRSARGGLTALPLRSAWAVATARSVYREIGVQVREQGARAWDERISTSRLDKLRLLCQSSAIALSSRAETSEPRPPGLWTRPR